MANTLISLGANLGNARESIFAAARMIRDEFGWDCVQFSPLYQTKAIGGPPGQDDFYNAVASIRSTKTAYEVWHVLHRLEQSLGRRRRYRWESRRIDLDVLLHEHDRIWTPTFKVPHPRMVTRTFVLHPANEIVSDWIEPVTGRSVADLSRDLTDLESSVRPLSILVVGDNLKTLADLRATIEQLQVGSSSHVIQQSHANRIDALPPNSDEAIGAMLPSLPVGTHSRVDWMLVKRLPRSMNFNDLGIERAYSTRSCSKPIRKIHAFNHVH